jgi:hypothetical protein
MMTTKAKLKPIKDRLTWLKQINLGSGSHDAPDKGACVMEAVAYVYGKDWTDHPPCVCPIIGQFLRSWNDSLTCDDDRNRLLKPLVLKVAGTKSTKEVQERRGWMCMDWLIRTYSPAWLDLVPSLKVHAEALRRAPEIVDMVTLANVTTTIADAQKEAWAADSAAYSAARSAAYSAAYSAADSAAYSAARSAADSAADSAAYSAADSAARSAAYSAAYSAARSAARSALKPAIDILQESAVALVLRLIKVNP